MLKFIVGLGNPGRRYDKTRHNVGFRIVDRFREQVPFGAERRKFQAVYCEAPFGPIADVSSDPCVVRLLKPQTYMNLSGGSVYEFLRYFGVATDQDLTGILLVVYDDIDLPEGRLRFRAAGSSGGHRGVGSVLQRLGHDRFSRLKVGVGRAGVEPAKYVLQRMDPGELGRFDQVVDAAVATLEPWIRKGVAWCMNQFNGPEGPCAPAEDDRPVKDVEDRKKTR